MVWLTINNTKPTPTFPSCLEYVIITSAQSAIIPFALMDADELRVSVVQYMELQSTLIVELAVGASPAQFLWSYAHADPTHEYVAVTYNWSDDKTTFRAKCAREAVNHPLKSIVPAKVEADLYSAFKQITHAEIFPFTEAERRLYQDHTKSRCMKFYNDAALSDDKNVQQWRTRFEKSPAFTPHVFTTPTFYAPSSSSSVRQAQRDPSLPDWTLSSEWRPPHTTAPTLKQVFCGEIRTHSPNIPIPTPSSYGAYTPPPQHRPPAERYTPYVSHEQQRPSALPRYTASSAQTQQPAYPASSSAQIKPSTLPRTYEVTNLDGWSRLADKRKGMPRGSRVVLTVFDPVVGDTQAPNDFVIHGIHFCLKKE